MARPIAVRALIRYHVAGIGHMRAASGLISLQENTLPRTRPSSSATYVWLSAEHQNDRASSRDIVRSNAKRLGSNYGIKNIPDRIVISLD